MERYGRERHGFLYIEMRVDKYKLLALKSTHGNLEREREMGIKLGPFPMFWKKKSSKREDFEVLKLKG